MAGESDRPLRPIAVIYGSRSKQHQGGPIPPADRNLLDLFRFNDARHLRIGAIDAFGRSGYRDALLELSDLQFHIERSGLGILQVDIIDNRRPEALFRDGDRISADGQRSQFIETTLVTRRRSVKS